MYRRDGRLLVAALVAHLDADADDAAERERSEADATELVDDLALRLATSGTSLTEAVGLFVAARRPFLDELTGLGRRRALDASRLAALYQDASGLLDRLLLRLIATYQDAVPGMNPAVVLPALTSILALVFAVALFDQWRERRGGFQLIWTIGMIFYGVGAACEALAAAGNWNEALYRTWYLTGAVWTAGWLGLGTAYLLGRTRFGYSFALCLFLAGLFTFLVRNRPEYAGAGTLPLLYFIAAGLLALAVAVETYFANDRWPILAAAAVVGATLLSVVLMATTTLPAPGYAVDPATGAPVATLFPPQLRLLTPFLNITGAFALILGAVFSTYVFMPKRRVLAYSLDPDQPGDEFLFNLLIAPVAIIVNLVASLPGARPGTVRRAPSQPRAGDHPDRDRCLRGDAWRHAQPVRDDRVVPARQVPRRAVPVRRLPGLDRGLPRDPDPVHVDPAGSHPPRTGRRRGPGRRRRLARRPRRE